MTTPILSVVVPSYNTARFIDEMMQSVLTQDFDDFELIVADHSSTDGTAEKLQEYTSDPRVSLISTEAGGGAERNFNRVTAEATGKYVKLVCGDDILLPGVLRRQVELLEANPGAVLTASRRRLVDASGKTVVSRRGLGSMKTRLPGREAIRATVRAGANLFGEPGCATMLRAPLARDGYWHFSYPFLVDQATCMRLLMHGEFVPDVELGAAFRMNSGQTSVGLTRRQYEQVSGFHRSFRADHPEVLSAADVTRGNLNAWVTAQKRRLAYALLKGRM